MPALPPIEPLPVVCAARPNAPHDEGAPPPDPELVAAAVDRVLLIGVEQAIAACRATIQDRPFTLEDLYAVVADVEAAAAAWKPDPYFDGPIARAMAQYAALYVRRPPAPPLVTSVF